ncbi:TPA: helix-turn-helix transcriptional regulator [Klebsiella quasipneumoniae]|nr:helix-turn-helix transcriptional regulator [Klebsiella quasipneumoniae]
MVNIVIKEWDTLFRRGLTFFFNDFFSQHNTKVNFSFNFTSESVKVADVIVLALCPGECFICRPELRSRKKSIVIGIVDDDMRVSALPSCFQDIIFLSRRHSVTQLRTAMHTAWHRLQQTNYRHSTGSCCDCQLTKLSPQQIRIMSYLNEGMSVMQIAEELMVSEKTVYTHKYMVMRKFNLHSDYELMLLLNKLTINSDWPKGLINVN